MHGLLQTPGGKFHAHIKTSLVGPSQTLIIHNGELVFGIWQDLYFCDFDGPETGHSM